MTKLMKLFQGMFLLITSFICAFLSGYIFADLCSGGNGIIQVVIILLLLIFAVVLSIALILTATFLED